MKEDIIAGLKNAIERGSTIETAVQSFVNAGYNIHDVEEAANLITQGAITIINSQEKGVKIINTQQDTQILNYPGQPTGANPYDVIKEVRNKNQGQDKKAKRIAIILIILIILLALAILGLVFQEKLLSLLNLNT